MNKHSLKLSLKQIADWQVSPNSVTEVIARLPSLQRGAVWEPQQIEFLWDSLFRGFPIGAIVLSKKDKNYIQHDKQSLVNKYKSDSSATHYILDGQQRCNAIAWAYANPWRHYKENTNGTNIEISSDQILWLDLKPDQNKIKNSPRKFIFRVTTKAHPWGFSDDNDSSQLTVPKIRNSMNKIYWIKSTDEPRPSTKEMLPYEASLPIPVCYLMEFFNEENQNINYKDMIEQIKKECFPLKEKITELIDFFESNDIYITEIINALSRVFEITIPYLEAPADIEIGDIEQIFTRLNTQGSPLDSIELSYSMIKAYWPEIEDVLSSNNKKHTTDARMVSALIRAYKTMSSSEKNDNNLKLADVMSVDQIRDNFKSSKNSDQIDNLAIELKNYLTTDKVSDLLNWIDNNLVYDELNCEYGIPKYLRSSIAWSSIEVFIWWLFLAEKYEFKKLAPFLSKKILAISLSVHWFGKNKAKCINNILKFPLEEKYNLNVCNDDKNINIIQPLSSSKLLSEALQLDGNYSQNRLKEWSSFWEAVVNRDQNGNNINEESIKLERREKYGLFIEKLKNLNELLVYVQRKYIEKEFHSFDPSNVLMWKGYNRPWDYDHILASHKLSATGKSAIRGEYHNACKAWCNSIGNLVAVDFSFNRSAQDTMSASEKYLNHQELFAQFDKNEIKHFDFSLEDTNDFEKSKLYVLANSKRMERLYRSWFDTLDVGQIIN